MSASALTNPTVPSQQLAADAACKNLRYKNPHRTKSLTTPVNTAFNTLTTTPNLQQ